MKIIANEYEEKDVIRMIRDYTDLTQKQFGENLGLSEKTIREYESGRRNYKFKTLMKIIKEHELILTIEKKNKK